MSTKEMNLRYYIKAPWKSKRTWNIVAYSDLNPEKREYFPFKDERIKAINSQFRSGKIDDSQARMMLKNIIQEKYRASEDVRIKLRHTVLTDLNEELFNEYWSHRYGTNFLEDEETTKYELRRALKLLGNVSLYSSSEREIQDALKSNAKNTTQHRRVVPKINQLLKFIKRDIQLNKPKKPMIAIKHLSKDEVFQLANNAPLTIRLGIISLFGTGCRVGEGLVLNSGDVRNGRVFIGKQLDKKGEIRKPKRERSGLVTIIPSTIDQVVAWSELEKTNDLRMQLYRFVTEESKKLFKSKQKRITVHDLRHSHAIYILEKGGSLEDVARNLRNTIKVCEDHYSGFAHTTNTADRLANLLKDN